MLDSRSDSCIKDSPLSEHSFCISGRDGNITYISGQEQVLIARYWEGLIHWPSTSLLLSKLPKPFGFSEVSLFLTLFLWSNIASFLLPLLCKVQCEWKASEVIKSFVPPLWVLRYWKWEIYVVEGGKHIICAGPQAWPRCTFLCSLQEFPNHTLSLFQNGMLLYRNTPTA